MENKENVRKPCPRPKKKIPKQEKKIPQKFRTPFLAPSEDNMTMTNTEYLMYHSVYASMRISISSPCRKKWKMRVTNSLQGALGEQHFAAFTPAHQLRLCAGFGIQCRFLDGWNERHRLKRSGHDCQDRTVFIILYISIGRPILHGHCLRWRGFFVWLVGIRGRTLLQM